MRENFEIDVKWTAFPLHPETPEDGQTLVEMFAGRNVNIDEIKARLKRVADEEGLPLANRDMTYNSRLAQELGKWAESKDRGDDFHNAAFRAYFAEGKNIAKEPVLIEMAEMVGLPSDEAREVIENRTFKEAVESDWQRSRSIGVTAVPTFVIDYQAVVGVQTYETLEKFIKKNNVKTRMAAVPKNWTMC